MKRYILRILCIVVVFLSATFGAMASSASRTQFSALAEKYDKLSSKKVMEAAARLADNGEKEKAIVLYTLVGNRFSESLTEEEKQHCVLAHVRAGSLYVNCGNYVKALDVEVEGVKMCDRCKEKKYKPQLYNIIGSIYTYFLDYETAANYYKKAYAYCQKYPDRETEYKILTNLTNQLILSNHLIEARKYYAKTEQVRDRSNDLYTYMSSYMKGLIERKEGKNLPQIKRFHALAAYAKEKHLQPIFLCYAYQELFVTYEKMGGTDSVAKYMQICYDTAKKYGVLYHFIGTIESLADMYEKNGDEKNAYKYQSIYLKIKDSIQNTRQFDMVKNKLFLHEVDKTTKEIDSLHEKEQKKSRTIRFQWFSLGGVLLFTICIAIFLIVVHRQKDKLNASYQSLFQQSKDHLRTQKMLERLNKENMAELEEKNRQIEKLQEKLHESNEPVAAADEVVEKYQTSSLNVEGKKQIERKIIGVMEETTEFCSTDFTLDRLAELVGTNSKYVSQVINDTYKKNFNSFINTYRIQLARERLIDVENYGNYTIKGIAESVGFKSPTTFINVFKKAVGLTPSMYQNMAKADSKEQ